MIDRPEMLAPGARRLVDHFVQACKDDELLWPLIDRRLAGRPIIDTCETLNVFRTLNWEPTKNRFERTEWLRQFIAWADSGEPLMSRERPPLRQCRLKLNLSKLQQKEEGKDDDDDETGSCSDNDPDWDGSDPE